MPFKVFIPTAGIGSRLGDLTNSINKSLVSLDNKPIISHIIDLYPRDAEFVIALGYKGEIVKEFLENLYPKRKINFVFIDPFIGENSGLGFTLLSCSHLLQEPFVFTSCDTLVFDKIPLPDHNWISYCDKPNINSYRTVEIESNMVKNFKEKGEGLPGIDFPYIGLCGINNFSDFWKGINESQLNNIEIGEVSGLINLCSNGLKCYEMNWFDTGNLESLMLAREKFKRDDSPVILEKINEAIWFLDEKVIKFSTDTNFIRNRVLRANELEGFVPKIQKSSKHMYIYDLEEGYVFSKNSNLPLFKKLLEFSSTFWKKKELNELIKKEFKKNCLNFYKEKTITRVKKFFVDFDQKDQAQIINGESVPTIENMFKCIDWEYLSNGLAVRFHGDFHFENILWNSEKNGFVFLDWRQDFAGSLKFGDLYYDLAKLMHGLIVSHKLIDENQYKVEYFSNSINFEFHRYQRDVEFEEFFKEWITKNNYDLKKVRILTALIYLNIASLHHKPYNYLLFALGKLLLFRQLNS